MNLTFSIASGIIIHSFQKLFLHYKMMEKGLYLHAISRLSGGRLRHYKHAQC